MKIKANNRPQKYMPNRRGPQNLFSENLSQNLLMEVLVDNTLSPEAQLSTIPKVFLRRPESLDAGSGTSKKIPLYHVPIVKQALTMNRGKPLVAHRTLKSFGKYLEMWKFRYF